ncbi:dipeptide ABC transporter ATP-binding protein [Synechococcales cyanobacterium C]|uniref:Dipeptide ABC transporter ATP-binding protein n=1 Tax=Petrachloros mirabilis ULC683 TaxID=2781853 RepID=A0A8K1ZXX0_9CYAN|nr:ABC transporter ATP-binding protein [Petrachloros mirabilis]NCJ05903.1 dipeptide ABC transporter ATP-binding protein [Petrachloros mirabilis ULC683]
MTHPILEIRNLRVQFATDAQSVQAVDGISFSLQQGQTLGLVGESGSGKSVTALAVMGLVPSPPGQVTDGEIWFRAQPDVPGVNLLALPEKIWRTYRGKRISMIFQEPMSSLNPVYTCGFQLIEALQLHQSLSNAEARRQAIALLQEVKLIPSDEGLVQQVQTAWDVASAPPSEAEIRAEVNQIKRSCLDRYPHQLSGGQIQRVMIALAISCNPEILIADEPTTALDVTVQARILDLLRELRDRRGMSIIFVTHDLGIIAELADTVAVMYQGKIVECGTVQQIFQHPQHAYTQGLLACRPRPDLRLKTLPTIADFIRAAKSTDPQPTAPEYTAPELAARLETLQQQSPLLNVQNLQVFFPVRGIFGQPVRYVPAVNGVSFVIYPGETLGLVGESGCGKTTLGRALVRLIDPNDGHILFANQNITQLKGQSLRAIRQDLQIIFQDPYSALDPRMTVGQAVMEPMHIYRAVTPMTRRNIRDRAIHLLERVGLSADAMHRYPHAFSGGQRQRICIARALALNPKFMVCDESVSALDVSVQAQVLNLLKELQQDFNLTYLFISHDLGVVKFMSDRIMVMNHGKIEESGTAEAIYRHPQAPYTQRLIAAIPAGVLPETSRLSTLDRSNQSDPTL